MWFLFGNSGAESHPHAWRIPILEAEQALLDSIDHPDVKYARYDTPIGGGHHIHTVEALSDIVPKAASQDRGLKESSESPPLVLFHGFGQGAASFWRNMPGLVRHHSSVYSIDWLGSGLSSRAEWKSAMDNDPAEAERYFVDALEAWRCALGIEKFHLLGHSIGAILACSYAERYPQHLSSLILASPAGVPPAPEDSFKDKIAAMPFGLRRMMFGLAGNLWEGGSTPQSVVRSTGWLPLFGGKNLVDGYVNRRFGDNIPSKAEFSNYMHTLYQEGDFNNGAPGGERVLSALLHPGAYAKRPLASRIPALEEGIPITFIYGDRDWMDASMAFKLANDNHKRLHRFDIFRVKDAGHQLHIDQPGQFNELVLQACRKCVLRTPRAPR